jgi:pimeloyl-ACP methyl ester carboxylesterase
LIARGGVAAIAGALMTTGAYPVLLHGVLGRPPRSRRGVAAMFGEWASGALASAARPLGLFAGLGGLPGASARGARPVVVVHGYAMSRACFALLARRLARAGHGPVFGFEYWTLGRVGTAAQRLAAFVAEVRARTGSDRVDIVGHSMGGVVARYYIAFHGGDAEVAHLVTVGSPLGGTGVSALAIGFASRELVGGSPLLTRLAAVGISPTMKWLALWSHGDVLVPAHQQVAPPGAATLAYEHLGHVAMLASRRVAEDISSFLKCAVVLVACWD